LDYHEDYVVVHSDVNLFPTKLFLCLSYIFLHTYVTYESKTTGLFVCFLQVVKENFFFKHYHKIRLKRRFSCFQWSALSNFCVRFCI